MDYLNEILKKLPVRTALDIATGMGYMAQKIAKYCPMVETIYAIDLNNQAIEKAQEINNDDRIEFSVMDAEQLNFAGNSLDLVTVQSSMHHFLHPEDCIEEMLRVLKPNSALLVKEQIDEVDTPEQKIMQDWHKIGIKIDKRKGLPHYDLYSDKKLRTLFTKYDFFHLAIERVSKKEVIQNPDIINNMIEALNNYQDFIEDQPDKGQLQDEIDDVINRLLKHGFAYPPSLIIFGMK